MLRADDIEVWVEMDGRPLPVYKIRESVDQVTCFIASVTGKNFSVRWKPSSRSRSVNENSRLFRLYLDGVPLTPIVCQSIAGGAREMSSVKTSMTQKRLFKFAPITLTDDETKVNDFSINLQEFGTIRLNVAHIHLLEQMAGPVFHWDAPVLNNGPIHEKSKKARTHRSALSDDTLSKVPSCLHEVSFRRSRKPAQDFVFQYASLEWLQAKGIAPRSSSTQTTPEINQPKRIKREREDDPFIPLVHPDITLLDSKESDKRKKPRLLKSEPLDGDRSILSLRGEVIDLTGDDDDD